MMLPLFLIGFLMSSDDRKETVMKAGPILFAVVALLIAILLLVTYRISLNTYKTYNQRNH